jgi:NitT/TauT family transport system substrate-binding protein
VSQHQPARVRPSRTLCEIKKATLTENNVKTRHHRSIAILAAAALSLLVGGKAGAEDIVVTNFGVSANGMPYAVALDKGFFKAEGIKVDNIITSAGGGTTLRNMLAANVGFAEINPAATSAAILQGVELVIIAETVYTVAEFAWITKKDSPVKTIAELKGKKLGFINPRGTSVAINNILLEKGGLKNNEVEHVRTGGFGEGLTALDLGSIDATPITEPLWSKFADKYRVLAKAADIMPPMNNVVAVTLAGVAKEKAEFNKAVLRARRKALDFMISNPDEAGDIIAKHYNLEPAIARASLKNLLAQKTDGVPYWSHGQIRLNGLKAMIAAQTAVGAISGPIDIEKHIDTSYLPDDLKPIVR